MLTGCPTWIRTTTKGSKDLCATITPSDRKAHQTRRKADKPKLVSPGILLSETATGCKPMQESATNEQIDANLVQIPPLPRASSCRSEEIPR